MQCEECRRLLDNRAHGWRAYRIDDPDEDIEPGIVFYCRDCADREFGSLDGNDRFK